MNVASMKNCCKHGLLSSRKEREIAQRNIDKLSIKTPNAEKPIGELSGGNQQKVILGRWLEAGPKVLILDEPTKGIDVGAKAEIYQIACDLAKQGLGIIFISSELPEILGVTDRILVMREGKITAELNPRQTSEEEILKYAMLETE